MSQDTKETPEKDKGSDKEKDENLDYLHKGLNLGAACEIAGANLLHDSSPSPCGLCRGRCVAVLPFDRCGVSFTSIFSLLQKAATSECKTNTKLGYKETA